MKALVDLYVQQFKTTFASMLQYRASLAIWMIGHVLEPLVYLIVWSTVSNSSGGSVGDYTTQEFAAYFLLLMLVNHVSYTWIMYEFEYRIQHGSLSFALLKPVHPIHSDIADNISSKLITFPFMFLVAVVLSMIFHPSFSPAPWAFAVCIPALLLAFLVRFLLEWTLAQAAFWTTRVSAINQTYFIMILFFSGQIAPLSLLPSPIRIVAALLPFKWVIGFPIELLLGRVGPGEALAGLGVQAVWLLISLVLVRVVWRAGVRIYSAVGA
ncbi:MAG: ABC-2 family transporter protein [candidate division KSB1 bacterium]|nr:ABC-2 family transporter protein [candidate division KSB1 bacterium]MDZ7300692.1 ABC-2 family transporter protein [candidate division KSB1 bacterium]MDZ7309828.1 ABC-2 family transporter protein [candidate division KSB1 bacterium]